MISNNEIRTSLLLKINSELNNKNKSEFKSILKYESIFQNYQIHFKEFFNWNSCEYRFISKNLNQREDNLTESNTNYITPSNSKENKQKENNLSNFNSSLKFLRNLCDDLKIKENKKKRFIYSKSKSF
jgi:hypothetical protein